MIKQFFNLITFNEQQIQFVQTSKFLESSSFNWPDRLFTSNDDKLIKIRNLYMVYMIQLTKKAKIVHSRVILGDLNFEGCLINVER